MTHPRALLRTAGTLVIAVGLVVGSATMAAAQTKTVHVGACVGATGTSLIQSASYGYGRTQINHQYCTDGYLGGAAFSATHDYTCQGAWYTSSAICNYWDTIVSMAHVHNVCDGDVTGICYGYFGTSDS